MLEAAGYPNKIGALNEVAKHLHVPAMTISRWFKARQNPPPNELVTQQKKELTDRLEELAHKLVDMAFTIAGAADTDASIQQVATSMGIVVDKWQLLKGKATERHEIVDLSDSERAARIATLLERAGARRDGRAADSGEYVQ